METLSKSMTLTKGHVTAIVDIELRKTLNPFLSNTISKTQLHSSRQFVILYEKELDSAIEALVEIRDKRDEWVAKNKSFLDKKGDE